MKTILITAAGGGASNNLMRAIRTSGADVRIVGANIDKFYLALSPADINYLVPRADRGEQYIDAIRRIVGKERVDLIIVGNDAEVEPIARNRERLGARTFLPSPDTIRLCQDKLTLNAHFQRSGIPVAESAAILDLAELERVFSGFEGQDMLWCRQRHGSASKGSLPVKTVEQARAWIDYWQDMRRVPPGSFMLCEYLPGRDFAFQSLWNRGELVIAKTCERVSYLCGEWMPSGTSSTPRVGRLTNDPRVNEVCTNAVRCVDREATGMFCIDLKENRRGLPCVTEINIGRFFMISPIFNLVGRHNMALLYLKLAFGEAISVPESDRFSDIGEPQTMLVRELDNQPAILTEADIDRNARGLP